MEIYDLMVFLTVVESGGFTRAAEKLNCVQPNVTARIKKLESTLDAQLFYRENRGVTLTANGRELIGQAKQIVRLAKDTETRFSQNEISGLLNIGVSQTAATAWLPKILQAFIKHYPEVEINVQSLFVETMTAQLLNHQLDCALTDISIAHPKLNYGFSRPEKLMLVHGVDYEFSAQAEVTTLTFSRASQYRRILYEHLNHLQVNVTRELTLKGMDAVLACIIGGVGVSLLPESVSALPHIAPHINSVPLENSEGRVGILTHVNNVETAALHAFMSVAREIIVERF
ncbi:MAG: LysR family transcriptional regulator [Thermodesulfobacteriota bacterium]